MKQDGITRRGVIAGAVMSAGTPLFPSNAHALVPLLFGGIRTLVTLWAGYKMAKEVYEQFFAERKEPVQREIVRIYGPQYFTVNNYYHFGNPYKVPHLGGAEPGCDASYRSQESSTSLCCGALGRPVFVPTGCIVALHSAVRELQRSLREESVFAYTRPIRYVRPVEPWQPIDAYGNQLKTDLQYYSPSGSVALRWLITDRSSRTCRGEYKIRDDTSYRIVAEGQTEQFIF